MVVGPAWQPTILADMAAGRQARDTQASTVDRRPSKMAAEMTARHVTSAVNIGPCV